MSEPFLLAVTGRAAGIRYPLEAERTMIGRSSACHIQLVDEGVSRQHAVIIREVGVTRFEDHSASGSKVNGASIHGSIATLNPGDVIAVGLTTFLFAPDLDYLIGLEGADVIISGGDENEAEDVAVSGEERGGPGLETADLLLGIVARALDRPSEEGAIASSALKAIAERFRAERAFLMKTPGEDGARPKVIASFGSGPITVSRTVIERVIDGRRALVSGDAAKDVAFKGGVSIVAGEIRSLLAAPLLIDGRAIGMVHLDRRSRNAYGPADLAALIPVVNVLALLVLASEGIERLKKRARRAFRIEAPTVIAESESMKQLVAEAMRAAASSASVLLTGETGTGKEVLARAIHAESDRRSKPFVAVNLSAIPHGLQESELFGHEKGAFTGADKEKAGLFELAHEGTLFLDEVGECDAATQVKLLRALQERAIFRLGGTRAIEVDIRVVAATSRRLEEMIARQTFREDLYYRLAVIHLRVPALRDRMDDVAPLAHAFVAAASKEAGIASRRLSKDLIAALERHAWPGNVRELRNLIERLVILADEEEIGLASLPADLLAGSDVARRAIEKGDTLAEAIARVEREMILRALARTGGVKSAVADALGISRVTLDAKLKAHQIEWPRGKKS
jgi:DNA-binding NtrC family response regulator